MQIRKVYQKPALDIVNLQVEDVVRTSMSYEDWLQLPLEGHDNKTNADCVKNGKQSWCSGWTNPYDP